MIGVADSAPHGRRRGRVSTIDAAAPGSTLGDEKAEVSGLQHDRQSWCGATTWSPPAHVTPHTRHLTYQSSPPC